MRILRSIFERTLEGLLDENRWGETNCEIKQICDFRPQILLGYFIVTALRHKFIFDIKIELTEMKI